MCTHVAQDCRRRQSGVTAAGHQAKRHACTALAYLRLSNCMQSIGDRDGAVGATSASGAAAPEGLAAAEHSEHLLGEQDVAQDARLYTLPGLEGQVRRRRHHCRHCPDLLSQPTLHADLRFICWAAFKLYSMFIWCCSGRLHS